MHGCEPGIEPDRFCDTTATIRDDELKEAFIWVKAKTLSPVAKAMMQPSALSSLILEVSSGQGAESRACD